MTCKPTREGQFTAHDPRMNAFRSMGKVSGYNVIKVFFVMDYKLKLNSVHLFVVSFL